MIPGAGWSRIYGAEGSWGLWSPLVAALSGGYGLGVGARLAAYRCGLLKDRSLPAFVVSVGNLTAGGTGKTPMVLALAAWGSAQGHRVAILSRGYGGERSEELVVVSDGSGPRASVRECGDEPYLLASRLPGVTVIVSRDRYAAGKMAIEDCGADFLVLDDGFQHLRLKRDLDIVLLDGSRPFGNGRLLPFGPLREPVKELVRAHAFVLTRCSEEAGPAKTEGRLRGLFPDKPVFRTDHAPDQVIFPRRNLEVHPSTVAGTRVVGFAGIARPEGFLKTLEGLGAEVVHFRAFGDHHAYSAAEVRALEETRRGLEAEFLLTTEKDWVRISGLESPGVDLGFLSIQLRFLSDEVGFFDRVGDGLERKRVALASHL